MVEADTVLFLVVCIALLCGVIWQMDRSHREEIARLHRLREADAKARDLLDMWKTEGVPRWVEAVVDEVEEWRTKQGGDVSES